MVNGLSKRYEKYSDLPITPDGVSLRSGEVQLSMEDSWYVQHWPVEDEVETKKN